MLWAALISLAIPGVTILLPLAIDYALLYQIQVLAFALLAISFRWTPLKMCLVPKSVKQHRAARLARAQFFALGLHTTSHRAAVLIFVSVGEHYVEILADEGINNCVAQDTWETAIAHFVSHVKRGEIATGFLKAISDCRVVLEKHFPAAGKNPDELPNHLIEL